MSTLLGDLVLRIKGDASGGEQALNETQGGLQGLISPANMVKGALMAGGVAATTMAGKMRPLNERTDRLAQVAGMSSDAVRQMTIDLTDATFPIEDVHDGMEALVRRGIDSEEQLRKLLPVIDQFADATGKSMVEAVESADGVLRAFNIPLEEAGEHIDTLTYVTERTDIPLATLERNLGRVPDELKAMNIGLEDSVAYIQALMERGYDGQEAVREFRREVESADGNIDNLNSALDISEGELRKYNDQVASADGLTESLAETIRIGPWEQFQQWLSEITYQYGEQIEMIGQYGFALTAVVPLVGKMVQGLKAAAVATKALIVAKSALLGPIGLVVGALAVIGGAVYTYQESLKDAESETEKFERQVEESFNSIRDNVRQSVIEQQQAIVRGYQDMARDVSLYYEEMYLRQIEITDQNQDEIMSQVEQHKDQYLAQIEDQRDRRLGLVREMLRRGVIEEEEHAQEVYNTIEQSYEEQKGTIEQAFIEKEEILRQAHSEQRALTQEEAERMEELNEEIFEDRIEQYEGFAADWVAVETQAYHDIEQLDREQLADRQDRMDEMFEGLYDQANDELEEHIKVLKEGHAEGILSTEQFEEAMGEALDDYSGSLDEISDKEKEVTDEIVKQKQRMRREALKEIDATKHGSIMGFQVMSDSIVGNSIVPNMVKDIIAEFGNLDSIPGMMFDIGQSIVDSFLQGLKDRWDALKAQISGLAQTIADYMPSSPAKEGPLTKLPDFGSYIAAGLEGAEQEAAAALDNILSTDQGFDYNRLGQAVAANAGGGFSPTVSINSPNARSPAQERREQEKLLRKLGFEWGVV